MKTLDYRQTTKLETSRLTYFIRLVFLSAIPTVSLNNAHRVHVCIRFHSSSTPSCTSSIPIAMHALRKMAASSDASLFASTNSSLWRAALGCYEEVVGLVMAQKKKKPKSEGLLQLDKWWAFKTVLSASLA